MEDPGLIVLPTHRLFRGLPPMTSRGIGRPAGPLLHDPAGRPGPGRPPAVWEDIETGGNQGALGLFTQKDQRWLLAELTDAGRARMAEVAKDHNAEWRALGVSLLHRLLDRGPAGRAGAAQAQVRHQVAEVVEGLATGEFPLAALVMPATRRACPHDQPRRRAAAGQEHLFLPEAAQRPGDQSAGMSRQSRTLPSGHYAAFHVITRSAGCEEAFHVERVLRRRAFHMEHPHDAVRQRAGLPPFHVGRTDVQAPPAARPTHSNCHSRLVPSLVTIPRNLAWRRRGADPVRGESERGRGQDDHGRQPGRRTGQGRLPYPVGRSRPAMQRHLGPGPAATAGHPLVAGTPIRQGVCPTDIPRLDLLPGSRSFRDVEALTARTRPRGGPAPRALAAGTQLLRLRADRLPAVAGPPDPHRPGQLDRSAHAHPMRVFRHGGAHADDRDDRPDHARARPTTCSSAASC